MERLGGREGYGRRILGDVSVDLNKQIMVGIASQLTWW
jgi:hypothetical protein